MKTPTSMVCICCPLGCTLQIDQAGGDLIITGNKCPRGKKYATEEMTAPQRIVTSTVAIKHAAYPVVAVKTAAPIPKEKIFVVMEILSNVLINAPVKVGDVVIANVADTGVDVVATKSLGAI